MSLTAVLVAPSFTIGRSQPYMKVPGLRHSAEQVGGIVFFGRMLDKIRLHAHGKLPPDYKHGTGTDTRVCRFLQLEYPQIAKRTLEGGTDEEILEWCFEQGRRPNEEDILMFNAFLTKRAWRDSFTEALEQMKRERGFQNRTDIQTFFDFHKADEEGD
jgi:Domain of unknown function (DUF5069)